jgi:hypothetical protein
VNRLSADNDIHQCRSALDRLRDTLMHGEGCMVIADAKSSNSSSENLGIIPDNCGQLLCGLSVTRGGPRGGVPPSAIG